MTKLKKKKLGLNIFPAIAPLLVGVFVALLVLGNQIATVLLSLVTGYFAFLISSLIIELTSLLKRRKRNVYLLSNQSTEPKRNTVFFRK